MASDAEILAELEWLLTHGRPAWHQQAACRGVGPSVFFLERGGDPRVARRLCAACPVAPECAEAALGEAEGIWAGASVRRRRTAA